MITVSWWQLLLVFLLLFLAGMAADAFLHYYRSLGTKDGGKP